MKAGYDTPLYLLPFDHRQSYVADMFHFKPPLSADQHARVVASKQIIYEGFREALDSDLPGHPPTSCAGILVDEEFGAEILHDAIARAYITAISVEKSGSEEFEFEYGDAFAAHIEAFKPSFAKVLVRYNPQGDAALNLRQTARLKQLSDYCQAAGQRFMFELLVPATKMQMAQVDADKDSYDRQIRPLLMCQVIRILQDAGVEPDVWKIEGLDRREDCEQLIEVARRDGRDEVVCIVLGRGADQARVESWLTTAAAVPGFIGFAVGRTTFWDAVADFVSNKITREDAISRIAQRYRDWILIFEKARSENADEARSHTSNLTRNVSA